MDGRVEDWQVVAQFGGHVAALAQGEIDPLDDLAPWCPDEPAVTAWVSAPVDPTPRYVDVLPAAPAPERDARIHVHPDAITHAGTGLGCVFTVEYADGDHTTFRVSRGDRGTRPLFGAILTGHYNDDPFCYTYVGIVTEPHLRVRLTAGSKPIAAAAWPRLEQALTAIRSGVRPGEILRISNAGWCSRCGRMLTTPESLREGIGPECRKKES